MQRFSFMTLQNEMKINFFLGKLINLRTKDTFKTNCVFEEFSFRTCISFIFLNVYENLLNFSIYPTCSSTIWNHWSAKHSYQAPKLQHYLVIYRKSSHFNVNFCKIWKKHLIWSLTSINSIIQANSR